MKRMNIFEVDKKDKSKIVMNGDKIQKSIQYIDKNTGEFKQELVLAEMDF